MPRYDVHVYATVRIHLGDIEAASESDACVRALTAIDPQTLLHQSGRRTGSPCETRAVEFADEIQGFLVDRNGDVEYRDSTLMDLSEIGKPHAVEQPRLLPSLPNPTAQP